MHLFEFLSKPTIVQNQLNAKPTLKATSQLSLLQTKHSFLHNYQMSSWQQKFTYVKVTSDQQGTMKSRSSSTRPKPKDHRHRKTFTIPTFTSPSQGTGAGNIGEGLTAIETNGLQNWEPTARSESWGGSLNIFDVESDILYIVVYIVVEILPNMMTWSF